jgi:hypothetical protein
VTSDFLTVVILKILSSVMWRLVVCFTLTDIVEEHVVSSMNLEEGDNRFLRNTPKRIEWSKSQLTGQ